MQRSEYPHNSSEQINGYITSALELVAELDPPWDLRAAVFTAAVGLYGAKQIMFEQPQLVGLNGVDLSRP